MVATHVPRTRRSGDPHCGSHGLATQDGERIWWHMRSEMKNTENALDLTARVLIRSFWMGVALQLLWFGGFLAGGQWAYEFHQHLWTGLTRHEFDLINLVGLAVVKFAVLVGFLIPYLAIRWVLSSSASEPLNRDVREQARETVAA